MNDFCTDSENCRRKNMLAIVGSKERLQPREICCDVCNLNLSSTFIVTLQGKYNVPVAKQRRHHVRRVTSEQHVLVLTTALEALRQSFLNDHTSFYMLGVDYVLPTVAIKAICEDIDYIDSAEYIRTHFNVRPELCGAVFSLVCTIFGEQ